jgi:hypothetical protein
VTRDYAKWVLLILPVLLAIVNPNWLYSRAGYIDPWFYFGYFQHLGALKTSFRDLYYGSRLPWVLPGHLAYRYLSPVLANYVLHFGFYYAATFSVYSLLKRAVGRKNALLGAILFGTHSAFLVAIGWDYVDGAGITYNLLALASVARATEPRSRRFWLTLAGAAASAMVYTNLFLVVFLPFHMSFVLLVTRPQSSRRLLLLIVDGMQWLIYGSALVTVLLGTINYVLDGNFWFYTPSLTAFFRLASKPNPWRVEGVEWVMRAYWLGVPAAVAVASVVYVLRRFWRKTMKWGDFRLFFVVQYLAAASVMVVWYSLGGVGLQLPYYASYLIPSMFLAVASMTGIPEDQLRPRVYWSAIFATVAIFAFSIWLAGSSVTYALASTGFVTLIAVPALGLAASVIFPERWYSLLIALLGLFVYQIAYLDDRLQPARHSWERIVKGAQACWPYVESGPTYFWYDQNEPFGGEFTAINSIYLWGFSYIGPKFPALEVPTRLHSGATVVLLSSSDLAVETAKRVLNEHHLEGRAVNTTRIGQAPALYNLTFFNLRPVGDEEGITVDQHEGTYDLVPWKTVDAPAFPPSGWRLDGTPRIAQQHDGTLVTTADRRYAYGSLYGPLRAKRGGTYRFALRYRIISGGILYGGMAADMSHNLGRADLPPPTPSHTQMATYEVELNAGDSVVLLIANDPPRQHGSSTYLIESVHGTVVF